MKNKILSIFLLLIAANLYAQVPRGFSAAAGANMTTLNSKDLLADGGIGYSAGIGFNFGYHESYNYEFNILYNQNALKLYYVDQTGVNVGKANFNMQTVSFGGYFNYYIIKPDEDKFYAGALLGVNLNFGGGSLSPGSGTDTNNQYYLPYRLTENSLSTLPKFTYSPTIGAVVGYNKFRFAVRYHLGMTDVLKEVQTSQVDESNTYVGPTLKGKVNSVSAILYYKFF